MQQQVTPSRVTLILFFWMSLVWGALSYYILAPSNGLMNIPRVHWSSGNIFDDAISVTAVNHYRQEGLFANWGLENRGGTLTSGKFGVKCSNNPPATIPLTDRDGNEVVIPALNEPCIYMHCPPLHHWVNSLALTLFDGNWRLLKVFMAFLATLSLLPLFILLRRLTSERAALLTILTYSTAFCFWGWSTALYNQSYQFLLFYCLLALPLERRPWISVSLTALSFSLAMTTYELVLALLIFFSIKEWRHQLRWIVLGLGCGFILMTALKVLALGSLPMALQDYLNTALNLYPIAGDLTHWSLGAFPIMARTISEQWPAIGFVLLLFFIMVLKDRGEFSDRAQKYFLLSLVAMLIKFLVLPNFLLYHTHVLHRFFHFPLLIALSFTFYGLSRSAKKFGMLAAITFFILITIPNFSLLANWFKTFDSIWQSPAANELTYNFSDMSEEVLYPQSGGTIPKSHRLRYNTDKLLLVDGITDRMIAPPLVLEPKATYHFDWIYPQVFALHRVRLIVETQDAILIRQNCSIANWFEQLQEIPSTVLQVQVASSHQTALDYLFEATPSRGVRLRCRANQQLMIDELKVFSAE